MLLNVADWMEKSVVNGPGQRFVLWLQGCSIHCAGCINLDYQSHQPKRVLSVEEVAQKIIKTEGIEGITISGGEPTEQIEPLSHLCRIIQGHGLSVVLYSGYTIETLRNRDTSYVNELLESVDILIDGPFIQQKKEPLLWRGSSNQRVHFLSERYRDWETKIQVHESQVEISFGSEGFSLNGYWDELLSQHLLTLFSKSEKDI